MLISPLIPKRVLVDPKSIFLAHIKIVITETVGKRKVLKPYYLDAINKTINLSALNGNDYLLGRALKELNISPAKMKAIKLEKRLRVEEIIELKKYLGEAVGA